MENTTQREPRSDSADHQVEFKQKKCLSTRAARTAAVLVGIFLAAVAVLSAYAAGAFDSNPDLPEIMEGEATFTADDGKGEVFHVMIDYKRKLIQLTSLNNLAASPQLFGRRLMSFEENETANGTRINATKIVIQDYNAKRKYFIVPENGNSTTKCIYTDLEGDMIPRHLLKHATLKSESVEGNMTHILFQVDNDTDVDVYRAKGYNGKIYEIYLHLPNGSIHMRSKEKEMNFTDYKHLNCYRYIEGNEHKTKMALPTLQPYWLKNYKNRNEGLMVRKTQYEAERREAWDKNARYFDRSNVETTKQRVWGSRQSYEESMQALDGLFKEDMKHEKQQKLEERKKRLSEMLLKETKEFEEELKAKRLGGAGRPLQMKERADELKADKETRRKEIAEQKMYEHWKQNAPELREIEADQLREHVVNSWADQVSDREENLKSARQEDRRLDAAMERERLLALEKEKAKEEAKKREQENLAEDLKRQMEELKMREEEALMLKQEQEDLLKEQRKLEQAEEDRRLLDEARRKREFGRVLIRQHKAQMKRKSKEIQEALELDLKILEALTKKKDEDKILETSRREKARADAEYMRQVVAQQLKLEQQREAELDMLYRDEAARMWTKREAEWERERLARERLMAEVLDVRKRQLDDKMEENKRRQQESIESREELLRELEDVQRMTAREKVEEERQRREREEEIQAQITSRREKAKEMQQIEREELERERREKEAYNQMLRHEADHMRARGAHARFVPRRRTAFE